MVVSGLSGRKTAKAAASVGRGRSTSAESSSRMVISPGGIRSLRSGPCGPVNLCATDQARATRIRGLAPQLGREYDPADTLRYESLRLHEAGLVKTGTDWRFINELKKELKA